MALCNTQRDKAEVTRFISRLQVCTSEETAWRDTVLLCVRAQRSDRLFCHAGTGGGAVGGRVLDAVTNDGRNNRQGMETRSRMMKEWKRRGRQRETGEERHGGWRRGSETVSGARAHPSLGSSGGRSNPTPLLPDVASEETPSATVSY